MKQYKIEFQNNYNYVEEKGEVNNEPSMTVQEDSFTIQQLMERHLAGMPLEGKTTMDFESEDEDDLDLESFNRMDLTEKDEVIRNIKKDISEKQEYLEELKAAQEAAELEAKKALEKQDTVKQSVSSQHNIIKKDIVL